MKLELIGYDLCHYVHRSWITVLHKKLPCKITPISRSKTPDWFRAISPSGKVPVLRVDGHTIILESAVINEYLDEISGGGLMPDDPLQRALHRSWTAYGGGLLDDLHGLMHAKSERHFDAAVAGLHTKLAWVETSVGNGPLYNGSVVSLIDYAYAPLFVRTHHLGITPLLHQEGAYPKIRAWSEAVIKLPPVRASLENNFDRLLHASVRQTGPYAAKRLGF